MESNFVTDALPMLLAVLMFGMGTTLTAKDFRVLLASPKSLAVILVAQLILLPLLGIAVGFGFGLPASLAIGLVLLCACPGGTTSNMFTFLARGNLALSISLTTVAGLVIVFSLPFWVNIANSVFSGESGEGASLPFLDTVKTLLGITLVPVVLGMIFRVHYPSAAEVVHNIVGKFALILMVGLTAALIITKFDLFAAYFVEVGAAVVVLNGLAVSIGGLVAALFALPRADSSTAMLEVGIQNSTMAIVIATSLIGDPAFAIPASIYSFTMYGFGFAVVAFSRRQAAAVSTGGYINATAVSKSGS